MAYQSKPRGCLRRIGILIGILVLAYLLMSTFGIGPFLGPEHVEILQPAQAVIDARRMIQEKRDDPDLYTGWLYKKDLPESLQLSRLAYVMVFEDHVSLAVTRNPDWEVGFRIWSVDATRAHQDHPTEYPEIFFYDYSNDAPEGPDNTR